jgi:hypothetical protein
LVGDSVFQKLPPPLVTDGVKETPNVRINEPVHFALRDTDKPSVQSLVTAASGTKAVTEPQKVVLVATFQNRARCLLDNFVLQG